MDQGSEGNLRSGASDPSPRFGGGQDQGHPRRRPANAPPRLRPTLGPRSRRLGAELASETRGSTHLGEPRRSPTPGRAQASQPSGWSASPVGGFGLPPGAARETQDGRSGPVPRTELAPHRVRDAPKASSEVHGAPRCAARTPVWPGSLAPRMAPGPNGNRKGNRRLATAAILCSGAEEQGRSAEHVLARARPDRTPKDLRTDSRVTREQR